MAAQHYRLHLDLVQLLDLLVVSVRLVAHQRAVEVNGEDDEYHAHRHHDDSGGQRRLKAGGRSSGGVGEAVEARVYGQEFDPAEEHHLGEEQQDAQRGGEAPGQLDVEVHALVRRLADGVQVVDVADGLHVGQDAGADEQGEQMHRHQHRGAHAEGYEERRVVQLPPAERLHRVMVGAHQLQCFNGQTSALHINGSQPSINGRLTDVVPICPALSPPTV
ncbi:hypothetical protein F7725_006487, partial [Dissostichus mawsoni]